MTKIEAPAYELQIFNVSLYRNLFNEVVNRGFTHEEAREVVTFAATNDGYGVITENISGAKDDKGNYFFDVKDRIRMQLTPTRHYYFAEDLEGEAKMIAPEHKWRGFKKDILEVISDWRRGMDKVGMAVVRELFLNQSEEETNKNEMYFWGSPKAESWEGDKVMRYNGQYGFLYAGRVVNINGLKALEVYDFKNDLDSKSYSLFLDQLEGQTFTDPLFLEHPLLDKVKASVVRVKENWDNERIWRELAQVQTEVTGETKIFSLPIESIIALQDLNLHEQIRLQVAAPVADWIATQIYQGAEDEYIQSRVKQKFIERTLALINKIKVEQFNDRYLGNETATLLNKTIPLIVEDHDVTNPAILARYTGSNGDGCGSWGGNNSNSIFTSYNSPIKGLSSVEVMSSLFGSCKECPRSSFDNHYHCPECKKPYVDETHRAVRTPVCSCGFEFGC